ncbi:hypothetical protein B0H14DRAFT_2562198 [Mycena olivaceomarginata]|nr:hypothetical protein B0H14DRAFT_2562198 [Mycena olivaceomarginata]
MERAVGILTLSVAESQYNFYNRPQTTSGQDALFRANGPIIQGDCLQWVETDPGGSNEVFRHEKIGPIQRRTQSLRERLWKILNSSRPRAGGLAREELYRLVRAFELIIEVDTPGFKPVPNWELRLVSSIHSKKRDVIEVKYMFGKRVIRPIKILGGWTRNLPKNLWSPSEVDDSTLLGPTHSRSYALFLRSTRDNISLPIMVIPVPQAFNFNFGQASRIEPE